MLYGENLPQYIKDRLDKELNSIIGNKFAPIYYIAYMLVDYSKKAGYVVGSRGSVGSSLVAYMMDITEVNGLPPHYYCPKCKFTALKLSQSDNPLQVEKDLMELYDKNLWKDLHLKLLFFGRYMCKAQKPNCVSCPFKDTCDKYKI